jgi:hypothetical protein
MNQNTIIEYPENDNGPKPYIMWEAVSDTLYDRKYDMNNNISMQIN